LELHIPSHPSPLPHSFPLFQVVLWIKNPPKRIQCLRSQPPNASSVGGACFQSLIEVRRLYQLWILLVIGRIVLCGGCCFGVACRLRESEWYLLRAFGVSCLLPSMFRFAFVGIWYRRRRSNWSDSFPFPWIHCL
jgi:hypothetical protein